MPKIKKKKIQMHIAQRKELDVHTTKQKRDRNRTTTSLVLDSSMQRGRWEICLNQRIWLRLSSVFESRRISFFKIFLVLSSLHLGSIAFHYYGSLHYCVLACSASLRDKLKAALSSEMRALKDH